MTFPYHAYRRAAPPPITATTLSADLAVLAGGGGNVAIAIGSEGLMIIDGGLPNRAADLQKAIAEVDARKVGEKWLSQKVTMEAPNRTFEPLDPEGTPAEVFSKNEKRSFGKENKGFMNPEMSVRVASSSLSRHSQKA